MKLSDWNELYSRQVQWAIRRFDCVEFYNDTIQDWVNALLLLNEFEKELFKKYYNEETKHICIRYRTWTSLCRKYIKKCRKYNQYTSGDFIFSLWSNSQYYFPKINHSLREYDYFRPITLEELEYANKYLIPTLDTEDQKKAHKNTIWYSENSKVLTYRGLNAPVDNCWRSAHIIDDKGKQRTFDLIWDWYYPIDRYLDMEKGWKKYERKR